MLYLNGLSKNFLFPICCIILVFLTSTELLSKKRALIIAIGHYSSESGISEINALNDVDLIAGSIKSQGFLQNEIKILRDYEADKTGILKAFDSLEHKSSEGDIIFIHFSSHGIQVPDDNGDEFDNLDETIVTFNSRALFGDYTNDIRDDELGRLISNIQKKIGRNGSILVSLDACHSGTGTRGEEKNLPVYIESDGYNINKREIKTELGKLVVFSGCRFDKVNYEYKDESVGSLSWALSKSLLNMDENITYRGLFSKVLEAYDEMGLKDQKPMAEGDLDTKLFSGDIVKSERFFEVNKYIAMDTLEIKGGLINGLSVGDIIAIYKSGTTDPNKEAPITTGKIFHIGLYLAAMKLDKPLNNKNVSSSWCFLKSKSIPSLKYTVNIDDILPDNEKGLLNKQLEKNKYIKIVKNIPSDASIEIDNDGKLVLWTNNNENSFACLNVEDCINKLDNLSIIMFIEKFASGFSNEKYKIDVEYIPVDSGSCSALSSDKHKIFKEGKKRAKLIARNITEYELYFNIIEIYPDGSIGCPIPSNLSPAELLLEPFQEKQIGGNKATIGFRPPYGENKVIVFTAPYPIDFSNILRDLKSRSGDNQESNKLESIFKGMGISANERGSEVEIPETLDLNQGATSVFYYDIVEDE